MRTEPGLLIAAHAQRKHAEPMDLYGQPHCLEDDIVMRDIPGGWECPHCGHVQLFDDVELPPDFEGPSIHGG